jgi:LmbE family N-acetylglucosaminyl deacetylase
MKPGTRPLGRVNPGPGLITYDNNSYGATFHIDHRMTGLLNLDSLINKKKNHNKIYTPLIIVPKDF